MKHNSNTYKIGVHRRLSAVKSYLPRHQINQRGMAAVAGAFVNHFFMFAQVQDFKIAEAFLQQFCRIHVFRVGRPASFVLYLFGV